MRRTICVFLCCLGITFYSQSSALGLDLRAIAPDGVGLTLQKSPVLYYFISEPMTLAILLLRDSRSARLIVEVSLPSPNRPGFWPIRFKDYGIILDAGVEYRWLVSVIQVQEDIVILDGDIIASGVVERIPEDAIYDGPGPDERCDTELVVDYARSGIWYDAFACLGELIEADPTNQKLLRLRERLLRDVGIMLTDLR